MTGLEKDKDKDRWYFGKLDSLVAEHLFGWKWTKFLYIEQVNWQSCYSQSTTFGCRKLMPPTFVEKEDPKFSFARIDIPKYTTEMSEAWKIVDLLKREHKFSLRTSGPCYVANFGIDSGLNHGVSPDPTRAIIFAALRLKGVEIGVEEFKKND